MNAFRPFSRSAKSLERQERKGRRDWPAGHRFSGIIEEALAEPLFAAQWGDASDDSFRPFAVAVFELRKAKHLSSPSRRALYRELCLRKRAAVLADIVGRPVPARVVKMLGRTRWQECTGRDWASFFSIAMGQAGSQLGHVTSITRTLLRQFSLIPDELRVPGLLAIISSLDIPADRWARWQGFIARANSSQRAEFHRAARAIKSRGDFWDLYFRCEGRNWVPFIIPETLKQSKLLEPISSPQEMSSEADRMKNCLFNRSSRVQSGNRIFFRLRDGTQVNTELVRQGQGWVPGDVLGYENAPVDLHLSNRIRFELRRLAKSRSASDVALNSTDEDAYLDELRQSAQETFGPDESAELAESLQAIQAKSKSWSNGAYAIFELKRGGYVQFMSSPDGKEYLLEIASHKYQKAVGDLLTAEVVDLIERAGFVWPNGTSNFLRWFSVSSAKDIEAMADLALALLSRVFGLQKGGSVMVKTHIPA